MNKSSSFISRLGSHLRHHGIAWIAIFLTLGGSAYALDRASVGTRQLKPNAVKTGKIANGAVTANKLAGGSVDSSKLASGAVDTGKISEQAVTTAKIASGAVTADRLAPGAVNRDQVGLIREFVDIDDVKTDNTGTVADLYRHGPFTVKVRCNDRTGNSPTQFSVFITSTEDATTTALYDSPYYRLTANTTRAVGPVQQAGTSVFAVNGWTRSGRTLQASVMATTGTPAASNDCSFLITGFKG